MPPPKTIPAARAREALLVTAQILGISAIYVGADRLVKRSELPLPSNVVALFVLLLALSTGFVKLSWVERGAAFLVRHLVLFYVPLTVGLLGVSGVTGRALAASAFIVVVSTVVVLVVTGRVARAVVRDGDDPPREDVAP